jgi:hypothetical protein
MVGQFTFFIYRTAANKVLASMGLDKQRSTSPITGTAPIFQLLAANPPQQQAPPLGAISTLIVESV